MRRIFILLLLLCPLSGFGQGIIWQSYVSDKFHVPVPNPPEYGGDIITAIAHPNGGLVAIGSSEQLGIYNRNHDYIHGAASVRISSSGDSLGLWPLPGVFAGYSAFSSHPVLLRNNPDPSSFLAVMPRDTSLFQLSTGKDPLILRLDTSGILLDTFQLALSDTANAGMTINDAAFITPRRILVSGQSPTATPSGTASSFETAIVSWPECLVIWRHSFVASFPGNGPGFISQAGLNAVYLTGGSDSALVALRIDTLGNQTGLYRLLTTDSGQSLGGRAMPLPNGKFGYIIGWNEQTLAGTPRRPGTGIGVMDTAGHADYRMDAIQPRGRASYRIYESLVGANDDGSILAAVTHRGPMHDTLFFERYSASGQMQAQWAVSSPGRRIDNINDAVYLGDDKAYIVGSASSEYWVAYLDGVGNVYDPTETRGPRAQPFQAGLYPNPAADKLYVKSDKPLIYRIVDLKGATVLEGSVNKDRPVDVSAFPTGLYQMMLSDGGKATMRRFVKQ